MNIKAQTIKTTIVLFLFFAANSNLSFAQTKLTILYKKGAIKGSNDEYLKPNNTIKWSGKFSIDEFTINDSITYYQTIQEFEDKEEYTIKSLKKSRANKILCKSFVLNANYCNYAAGYNIEAIEWKDENYQVKTPIENKQKVWEVTEEKKVVLGYNCSKAIKLYENNEVEMVVWFFADFKCNYSNNGDTSLPGIALETYYPKSRILITAIDLQIETNNILTPTAKIGKLVSNLEFEKIKKNKKN
jgi:GLPGLI family protein